VPKYLNYNDLLDSGERNRKKKKYFPDFWLARNYLKERAFKLAKDYYYNTITKEDEELTKCFTTFKTEFWLSRGYSNEEAILKVKQIQKNNYNKIKEKYTKEEIKKFSNTSIEYYLKKGFSPIEAKDKLKERQATFTLEKCIKKYGQEEGTKLWKERQKRWQNTLNSKSNKEKLILNKKKGITLENYIKKYGKEIGQEKYNTWAKEYKERLYRHGMSGYSIEAVTWFESFIPKYILDLAKIKDNEFFINDGSKLFYYDFCYKNLIIEYHGHKYHYNPAYPNKNWQSPFGITIEESIKKDTYKRELAKSKGYKFFEFYSNSSKIEEELIKKQIIEALNAENNN